MPKRDEDEKIWGHINPLGPPNLAQSVYLRIFT